MVSQTSFSRRIVEKLIPLFIFSTILQSELKCCSSFTSSILIPKNTFLRNTFVQSTTKLKNNNDNADDDVTVTTVESETDTTTLTNDEERPECWYLIESENANYKKWTQRKHLEDLEVGQLLPNCIPLTKNGILMNGKTGPKLFFECGVGRTSISQKDNTEKWHMVNGMYRLGTRFHPKKSVVKKQIERFKKKGLIDLYVSKIRLDNGAFEVSLKNPLEITDDGESEKEKIKGTSLEIGQELIGTITQVLDFGVIVDVGATYDGLLHIQRVADLFDSYIDKAQGLQTKAGLEKGARIKVQVVSNSKKKLRFDFTKDVKEDAEKERLEAAAAMEQEEEQEEEEKNEVVSEEEDTNNNDVGMSEDDTAAWTEFAAAPASYDDDEEEEEYEDPYANYYDDYADYNDGGDEDRDIEDSLGLGSY